MPLVHFLSASLCNKAMTVSCLEESSSSAVAILPSDSAIRTSLLSRLFSLASSRRRATRSRWACSSCRFRASWSPSVAALPCGSPLLRPCPSDPVAFVVVVVANNGVGTVRVRQVLGNDDEEEEEETLRRLGVLLGRKGAATPGGNDGVLRLTWRGVLSSA